MTHHWIGLPDDWQDYEGFCYQITHLPTGKSYIGRKYFWTKSKSKRTGEAKWQFYTSSSKPLNADIERLGKEQFEFRILGLRKTRGQVNYLETKMQMKLDVLEAKLPSGDWAFYNENIMSRYFRAKEYVSKETKKKISEKAIEYWNSDDNKAKSGKKVSERQRGKKHTESRRLNIIAGRNRAKAEGKPTSRQHNSFLYDENSKPWPWLNRMRRQFNDALKANRAELIRYCGGKTTYAVIYNKEIYGKR